MPYSIRSSAFRRDVLNRDGWCCVTCGAASALCAHHIIPLVVGGMDDVCNGVTYCRPCHQHEHYGPSASAPMGVLSRIGRQSLPPSAILVTASWIGVSDCPWAGSMLDGSSGLIMDDTTEEANGH